MFPLRFLPKIALLALCGAGLSGCGAVETVRGRFAMPVEPTPSPAQIARLKNNRAFKSLDASLGDLNAEKVRAAIARFTDKTEAIFQSAPLQPLVLGKLGNAPLTNLSGDLSQSARPIAPDLWNVGLPNAPFPGSNAGFSPFSSAARTQILPARVVGAKDAASFDPRALARRELAQILSGWTARQNQSREEDEALARRNITDRVNGAARAAVEAVPLSPVPPDVQAELTNLHLQLLANLEAAPAEQAQAARRIEEIQARLREIWARETRRQAALLQAALVDVPDQLKREKLEQLDREIALQVATDRSERLQLRDEFERALAEEAAPGKSQKTLRIAQPSVLAPLGNVSVEKIQTRSLAGASSGAPVGKERGVLAPGALSVALNESQLTAKLRASQKREAQIWARAAR